MIRAALLAIFAVALAACTVAVDTPFDPLEGAYVNEQGTGTIEGSAFMRQRGGGTVTAAGNQILLFPVTTYSRARVEIIYQGNKSAPLLGPTPAETPPAYATQHRQTKADIDGRFVFENLAPGPYYVSTVVSWSVPGSYFPEGGKLIEQVHVGSGQTVKVVLSGS